jgi:TrmH family RNA methyltransferase
MASPPDPVLTAKSGRIRRARGLASRNSRQEQGRFLIEGAKPLEQALRLNGCVEDVFMTEQFATQHQGLAVEVEQAGGYCHLVDDGAIAAMSGAQSPQGIISICRLIDVPMADAIANPGPVVICANVRDPGNAGTIIRVADASGAAAVILAGTSVDLYNDKTLRATVGSVFSLPIVNGSDVEAAIATARESGRVVIAADGGGETGLYSQQARAVLAGPVAWVFGNEAWGLPIEIRELADHQMAIPIVGEAESLNLATAAAVCLYARFGLDLVP